MIATWLFCLTSLWLISCFHLADYEKHFKRNYSTSYTSEKIKQSHAYDNKTTIYSLLFGVFCNPNPNTATKCWGENVLAATPWSETVGFLCDTHRGLNFMAVTDIVAPVVTGSRARALPVAAVCPSCLLLRIWGMTGTWDMHGQALCLIFSTVPKAKNKKIMNHHEKETVNTGRQS